MATILSTNGKHPNIIPAFLAEILNLEMLITLFLSFFVFCSFSVSYLNSKLLKFYTIVFLDSKRCKFCYRAFLQLRRCTEPKNYLNHQTKDVYGPTGCGHNYYYTITNRQSTKGLNFFSIYLTLLNRENIF